MAVVDVLIPHLNDLAGLKRSLDSVSAQTYSGTLRIVLCDDGSPAEVVDQLDALLADTGLPHELIVNGGNKGRPRTRNILLDAVRSPYVAWLDAGDVWYPNKLEVQMDRLYALKAEGQDTSRIWITCNYDWKWEESRPRTVVQRTDDDQLKSLFIGSTLRAYLWTLFGEAKAFRKAGRFDENLPRLQDLDYFINFVRKGGVIHDAGKSDALCCYYKSDIGRNAREVLACMQRIHDKNLSALSAYGSRFFKTRQYSTYMHAARFAHSNRQRLDQAILMARAAVTRPRMFVVHVVKRGFVP